jgi:hypothetical protein
MSRVTVFAFAIASAALAMVPSRNRLPGDVVGVSAVTAATVRGGQCGSYQMTSNSACTDSAGDTCTSSTSDCDGLCSYSCGGTSSYGGSGSFTGALVSGSCDSTTQATCTETYCSVAGVLMPCCQCVGNASVDCAPSPNDLDTQGCSGT